ncbi:MAG: hypothetical protein LBV67_09990 [Streptococcaceae bacterium]|jgi:hypothetical protein|nr:hypothetical protein [Streptococcaceae bacterium]
MTKIKDIVPIQFSDPSPRSTSPSSKPKLAGKLKVGEAELIIYNGIDKYILYAILKELKSNDSRFNER